MWILIGIMKNLFLYDQQQGSHFSDMLYNIYK